MTVGLFYFTLLKVFIASLKSMFKIIKNGGYSLFISHFIPKLYYFLYFEL
jgi:hypothetical protein